MRRQGTPTPRATLGLSCLLVLLYFTHIVSLVMAVVALSVLAAWSVLYEGIEGTRDAEVDGGGIRKCLQRYVVPVLLGSLPAIFLTLFFFRTSDVQSLDRWSLFDLTKHLLTLSSLWSFQRIELVLSSAFVCVFVGVSAPALRDRWKERRLDRWDGLMVVGLVYVLLYLLTPDSTSQGQYISSRLLLFPYFVLLLWLGSRSFGSVTKGLVVAAACGIALMFLVLHTTKYAELNHYLEEYMSGASMIEENRTLLPLSFSHEGHTKAGHPLSERIRPFLFAAGYIAAERGIVDLHNYEARTENFPLLYRPTRNPFTYIWRNEGLYGSPEVDFIDFAERTGGCVDYVLLWGWGEEMLGQPNVDSILTQLDRGYRLIFTSGKGRMKLYRSNLLEEEDTGR
jgi:hypothetical protein